MILTSEWFWRLFLQLYFPLSTEANGSAPAEVADYHSPQQQAVMMTSSGTACQRRDGGGGWR